eukprot:2270438-Rhodomonas_salina.2
MDPLCRTIITQDDHNKSNNKCLSCALLYSYLEQEPLKLISVQPERRRLRVRAKIYEKDIDDERHVHGALLSVKCKARYVLGQPRFYAQDRHQTRQEHPHPHPPLSSTPLSRHPENCSTRQRHLPFPL